MSFEQRAEKLRYATWQERCDTYMEINDLNCGYIDYKAEIGDKIKPWREVDNRKAYMEKRMRMEGLE